MKMKLATKTYEDIMVLEPCYDPVDRGYIDDDWVGTALDVLHLVNVPIGDRLWVVLNDGWLPDRLMHDFAIWCAEQALALVASPEPRSLRALEVKRLWLGGNATDDQLSAAADAAWAAADAAWAAARAAARAAADAARAAAWAAAWAAAAAAQIEKLIEMCSAPPLPFLEAQS